MRPAAIFSQVGQAISPRMKTGAMLYDLVRANGLRQCLQLGTARGPLTAYIAGALQDLGSGEVTVVQRATDKESRPSLEAVLSPGTLASFVHFLYEPRSFNWRLMKLLEAGRHESFDLCLFSGDHTWYETGFAFCLAERLLRPGGWVLFDDLEYTFRASAAKDKEWVTRKPEDEQTIPQVKKVFELLVQDNPAFGDFRKVGSLGLARKVIPTWTGRQRRDKQAEATVADALARAKYDPEFRAMLLVLPAPTLSEFSGEPEDSFRRFRFVETEQLSPLPSIVDDAGTTTIFVEPPDWEKTMSESDLEEMLAL